MNKKYWLLGAIISESIWINLWLITYIFTRDRQDYVETLLLISIFMVIIGSMFGWVYGRISKGNEINYSSFLKKLLITLTIVSVSFIALIYILRIIGDDPFGFIFF